MQLNFFKEESSSTNSKMRKERISSFTRLYDIAISYFTFTEVHSTLEAKEFNGNFLFLCEDLINENEIEYVKKHCSRTKIKGSEYIGEYFDDPRKDYYEVLINYLKEGKASKKQLGAFYTPQDVVTTLIDSVIAKNGIKNSELLTKKVLDPTMGGGDWLTCWFEKILTSASKKTSVISQKEKELTFKATIHGVDIDPVAVLCTRLIFWHYLDYKSSAKKHLKENLILGNTLDIFSNGKGKSPIVDIVIGNPPYVVQNLKHINCKTNSSNNLFSVITEAASELLGPKGVICFVVPLNLTCAKSLSSLRRYMDENYEEITYSTYGIRPQKMFEGVDQRITVLIARKKGSSKTQGPKYISYNGHLQWRDRIELVEALKHSGEGCELAKLNFIEDGWPKIASPIESKVLTKISQNKRKGTFYDLISKSKTPFPVYYYGNARYFIKALDYIPFYKNSLNSEKENTELKVVFANDQVSQKAVIALLNSTLFYWTWVLFSDCFHMDIKILKHFALQEKDLKKIVPLSNKMTGALKSTSFKKKHGGNIITEFKVRDCLIRVKEIDAFLCDYFCLNKFEANFAKSYASDLRKSNQADESSVDSSVEEAA